jgi:hypothetical protein
MLGSFKCTRSEIIASQNRALWVLRWTMSNVKDAGGFNTESVCDLGHFVHKGPADPGLCSRTFG